MRYQLCGLSPPLCSAGYDLILILFPVIIHSAFTSGVQILTGEFLLGDPDRW